ncbi:hypothetical protein BGZ99_003610 [Dissophora globulifera]|uniref:Myb-like domain-containing protein n=1 Tax=Dissophora globulifera TaxID=979702 RepID=A0A9P6RLT7_9FUNG|nr:hypothetical protein BGZ99_003610 [Dissophora globulifera]
MKQSRVCWSQEQIERLTSILQRMRGDSEETLIQWDVVAIEMRGEFSKQQCKSRWNRMQRQGEGAVKSTGRWSEGEIDNLIRGVADLGDRWTEIHRQWLPGRTPTFIQAKWTALASKLRREMVIRRWTWKQACLETFGKEIDVRLGKLPSNWVDPHDIVSRPKRIDKAI